MDFIIENSEILIYFLAAAAGAEQIQPPPLAYKKYGLKDQDQIKDHITCGKFILTSDEPVGFVTCDDTFIF